QGRHPQALPIRPQAHAAVEGTLEDRQPAVRLQADEHDLAGLIRGEGERQVALAQPLRELARGQQLELRRRGFDAFLVHDAGQATATPMSWSIAIFTLPAA